MILCKPAVFEILLAFSQNKDWKKSFYEVIPLRKVADKSDGVSRPHQSTSDTVDELEDQPISLQYQTFCDDETAGASIHHSPVEVQRESAESEIIASSRNEECNNSDNGTSEGNTTVIA